LYYNNFE